MEMKENISYNKVKEKTFCGDIWIYNCEDRWYYRRGYEDRWKEKLISIVKESEGGNGVHLQLKKQHLDFEVDDVSLAVDVGK